MGNRIERSKVIYVCVIFSVFIIGLIARLVFEETPKDHISKEAYQGLIENVYIDSSNKQIRFIIVNGNKYSIGNDSVFFKMKVGDYIVKEKGTTRHKLISGGDTLIFYPIDGYGNNIY